MVNELSGFEPLKFYCINNPKISGKLNYIYSWYSEFSWILIFFLKFSESLYSDIGLYPKSYSLWFLKQYAANVHFIQFDNQRCVKTEINVNLCQTFDHFYRNYSDVRIFLLSSYSNPYDYLKVCLLNDCWLSANIQTLNTLLLWIFIYLIFI